MGLLDDITDIIGANDEHQEVKTFLDTGYPPLNKAISGDYKGGLPVGRIVEMFGPPSSGKTAIATKAMIAAQQAGGIAAFFDHERSFDIGLAASMGLEVDGGRWVFKTPRTFEESVTMAAKLAAGVRQKKLIDKDAPIICVFDSLASMVPQSKADKSAADYNMNDNTALARATSAAFPALAMECEENQMLCLFLNQARTKIGVMFGDPTTTPGGNAPEFYASVRIKLGRKQIAEKVDGEKQMMGQEIGAECVKNKITRPFQKAKWRFMFNEDGTGKFDVVGSLVTLFCEDGTLETTGARVKWTDGKTYYKKALIQKIEDEGLQDELFALLPEKVEEEAA